ncbi:STAS domain-containing protein [Mesobacillus maritimus]|uniref:STAS domain-containing protein n=1 Tax=Mesobacillus maritimus TaxID=1643336 RepID=UPI00203E273C|nr:STAS domain-containing protein [Mesobacillus maritimus]MCM3668304.1 STAS domain-containing protein [Mesobacillus maritimus]
MASMIKVSNYCMENAEVLAQRIVDLVIARMELVLPDSEKEQTAQMYVDFLKSFGEMLLNRDVQDVPDSLIEWSKQNSERALAVEGKISRILVRYPPTREILTDLLTDLSVKFELTLEENAFMIKVINTMLDISLNETILAFERLSDQQQEETDKELAELSAPIVPVKDGIVVLPLIGVLNPYRATYIKEKVIPRIAELKVDYVIMDFSGLLSLDVEVVHYLHQIEEMIRLMGINILSTGIRPDLAKVAVHNGINLTGTSHYGNVKQALESILSKDVDEINS